MSHVRQQIRDAAVTLLTGLTTTGTNVFNSRAYNINAARIPALFVYTNSESVEYITKGIADRRKSRELELMIEIIEQGVTDTTLPFNTIDTIIAEVETALAGATFGGLAKNNELRSITASQSGEGAKEICGAVLVFVVNYQLKANTVTSAA